MADQNYNQPQSASLEQALVLPMSPAPEQPAPAGNPEQHIAQLESEVASYRRLIGNVPGMVYQFVLRPDGWMGFIFVSEGSREVYGCEPEQIMQDYRSAFEQVHPEDVVSFMRSVRHSAAHLTSYKWEGRLLRDGQTRWIQAASRPHRQADGSILWDGIILDITHRKEADAALAHSFRQEETIRLQREMLAQLSTPLIPLTGQIMVMPLIGSMDQNRADRILETLLHGVETNRATTAIIDITGIPTVDAHTAAMIAKAAKAVKLLGAEAILTGIRAEVAQALVGMGIDLLGIKTLSTLQAAISYVLVPLRLGGTIPVDGARQ